LADIIGFPIEAVRDWGEAERAIKAILRASKASEAMDLHVTNRMKEHFSRLDRETGPFPASLSESEREALQVRHDEQTAWFLSELLKLETRLYAAQQKLGRQAS
jgi:hypothetical protein